MRLALETEGPLRLGGGTRSLRLALCGFGAWCGFWFWFWFWCGFWCGFWSGFWFGFWCGFWSGFWLGGLGLCGLCDG